MKNFLSVAILIAASQIAALAADPGLLGLVMPNAKVVAGIQVDQAKLSPFGRYVLSHMQPDDAAFQKFVKDTNFDPRRDLTEVVMASSADSNIANHWVVLARGTFDAKAIVNAARLNGGTITQFRGIEILSSSAASKEAGDSVIGFLDHTSAAMGDPDSVKAVIDRYKSSPSAQAALLGKVKDVSGKYDFWFTTLAPISEFAGVMPDPGLGKALQGNLFQSIQQATGGLKFGPNVLFSMEAVARSDKDASALVDVVRFVSEMIQSNRGKNGAPSEVSTLVDNLNINSAGNVMTMSLTVPEPQLERLLESARTPKQTAKK